MINIIWSNWIDQIELRCKEITMLLLLQLKYANDHPLREIKIKTRGFNNNSIIKLF